MRAQPVGAGFEARCGQQHADARRPHQSPRQPRPARTPRRNPVQPGAQPKSRARIGERRARGGKPLRRRPGAHQWPLGTHRGRIGVAVEAVKFRRLARGTIANDLAAVRHVATVDQLTIIRHSAEPGRGPVYEASSDRSMQNSEPKLRVARASRGFGGGVPNRPRRDPWSRPTATFRDAWSPGRTHGLSVSSRRCVARAKVRGS